jgi:hypothetical protein
MEGLNLALMPIFTKLILIKRMNCIKSRDFAGLTGNEIVYDLYTGTVLLHSLFRKKQKK